MKEVDNYDPLLESSDAEDSIDIRLDTSRRSHATSIRWLALSNVVFILISSVLSILLFQQTWSTTRNAGIKAVSYYNPIFDRIDIPIETVEHDNTLFAHSAYAQEPSPEVDDRWQELSYPRFLLINETTVRRIGKDPAYTVQHPSFPGQHIAYLAVQHQLHCLDSLRRRAFADYYHPNTTLSGTQVDHVLHCVDLLRQTLTCNANLDLITYNWWELTAVPQPDFRINMKCRNWDAVQAFIDGPTDETGMFRWDEYGWADGWRRSGSERNVSIDRQWWEIALDGGKVTQEEFDGRWGVSFYP